MLPPPAPMVVMSMCGMRTGTPYSTRVSSAKRGLPFATSETSKLVPPTSAVMQLRNPACWPMKAPATTPAAGPESTVFTGTCWATALDITPPLDCTISTSRS